MNGDDDFSKEDLEILIHPYGGVTCQYPTENTYGVIASRETLKVKNLTVRGDIDVIRHKWILDCIGREALLSLEPRYMIYTSPKTLAIFHNDIDKYGDSFATETSVATLREVFQHMDALASTATTTTVTTTTITTTTTTSTTTSTTTTTSNCTESSKCLKRTRSGSKLSQQEDTEEKCDTDVFVPYKERQIDVQKISQKYLKSPFWTIFSKYTLYFDCFSPVNSGNLIPYNGLDVCSRISQFYGATVTHTITQATTHVILDKSELVNASEDTLDRLHAIVYCIEEIKNNAGLEPRRKKLKQVKGKTIKKTTKNEFCDFYIKIVCKEWILESSAARNDLDEMEFQIDIHNVLQQARN